MAKPLTREGTRLSRTALILDDSKAIRAIVRSLLLDIGYDVLDAGNGKAGLEVLEENESIDLVLVDWHMFPMNGLEFIKTVRSQEAHKDLTLVMVSNEIDESMIQTAKDAGANEYITKAYTAEIIVDKLRAVGITI